VEDGSGMVKCSHRVPESKGVTRSVVAGSGECVRIIGALSETESGERMLEVHQIRESSSNGVLYARLSI
jgi:hypothetical protein